MKIKTRSLPFETAIALPRPAHRDPMRPLWLLRAAIRLASVPALLKTRFTFRQHRMELVGDKPCLILMNHSCFLDVKMASRIFFPRPYCIVGTNDGFVGKSWLMRLMGCIPTQKFVTDLTLIRDMNFALHKLNVSVLMFPEAGYSLDGRSCLLPRHLGVLCKRLKAPVVTVTTWGAFARDPLYNGLQLRKVRVQADVRCLLTPEEIRDKSIDELDAMLRDAFTFDQFAWQKAQGVRIDEPFRADGLHRALYQCPACGCEGRMEGKGTQLRCDACGKAWELTELGEMHATQGETEFPHIPDWFDWQRANVRRQVEAGEYLLDTEVDIALLMDHKALYTVGEGRLRHDASGFELTGCDGKLHYHQPPDRCYSLNVDYFWYEKGDMIAIGEGGVQYCCFPRRKDVVTRARLAAEAMYDLAHPE